MSGGVPQQSLTRSIRNCTNQTNIDTIQCESYAPKLRQRPPLTGTIGPQSKSVHIKPNRERSASRSRCIPSVVSNLSSGRSNNNNNRVRRENSVNNVIRKEVYTTADSPALVEVTVKTHGQNGAQQQQGRNQTGKSAVVGNRGEPWSKILQNNNMISGVPSEGSSFSNFDPLRTVHFLAQELQSKLQGNLSDDDHSIRQIISDMQQALYRVPPEVASTLGLNISPHYILQNKRAPSPTINGGFNYDYPTRDDMRQERLLGVVKGGTTTGNTAERGCQTAKCKNMVLEPEKFQQHLEFSTAKIESACRQMEVVCSKLKTDKEELERELLGEREQVLKLRAQLEQTSTNQKQLESEKNTIQRDMQQLKLQLGSNSSQSQLLQQLQQQKAAAEDQLSSYRQQLTISKMETEKYVAILAARDKQVTEIRSEMNQLQELVMEQLREIQTAPFSSSVTSCTTNATTSKQSFPWLPTTTTSTIHKQHTAADNSAQQFIDLDRNIYKEIANAMAAAEPGGGGGSSTAWGCNGGDTITTTYTSAGDSGASSTTTIAGARNSAANFITNDKQTAKSSNVDINEAVKAANLMLNSCSGLISSKATATNTNNNNPSKPNSNQQQQQQSIVEEQQVLPPHTISIRDMFAEIKKQALLVKTTHQQ